MTGRWHTSEHFAREYRATYPFIVKYTRRRVQHDQVADLVAEIYTIAWDKHDEFLSADAPLAWLYRVAYGVVSNHYRKKRRWRLLTTRLAGEPHRYIQSASATVEQTEDLERTLAALATLSVDDQELIALAAYEELTYAEIADITGRSEPSTRSALYRARKRLRAAFDEAGGAA